MAELGKNQNIIVGAASIYISNEPADGDDVTTKPAFVDETVADAADGESYRDTLEGTAWNPATTDPSDAGAWRNVGFTMEGLEVSYEPDYADVEVDQLLDSALIFKQSMRVSLNTSLAEATLLNLMISWGQRADTYTEGTGEADLVIEGGSLGEAPVERSFIAVGNGAYARTKSDYAERVYHAYRVLNVEQSTHGLRRNEATGIPVSFRALPSDTGLYGTIKDRKKQW